MLNKNDKIIEARLYSPHKCQYVCEREDGTHYLFSRVDGDVFYELHLNPSGETRWIIGEEIKKL